MKISCGAILYTYKQGRLGIILGLEGTEWLPFKGGLEKNETPEQAASREIYEETCELVKIDPPNIKLNHRFSSKRKIYQIGLCYAPIDIIYKFEKKRKKETNYSLREKKSLKFFDICNILDNPKIHSISKASIAYYWNDLMNIMYINDFRNQINYVNINECRNYNENYINKSSFRRKLSLNTDIIRNQLFNNQNIRNNFTNTKKCNSYPCVYFP